MSSTAWLPPANFEPREMLDRRMSRTNSGMDESGEIDASLVLRAKKGDADAFSTLYWRHLNRIFGYAYRRLGDRMQAEDATQTVFERAIAALPTCRDEHAFGGWLAAIAQRHHRCVARAPSDL